MKLTEYLDITYTNLTIELQSGNYSFRKDSETKTILLMMNVIRGFFKWSAIPKYVVTFFLVKTRLVKAPESRLEEFRSSQKAKMTPPKKTTTTDAITPGEPLTVN